MGILKKWTGEVWFGSRETEIDTPAQPAKEKKGKKEKSPKKMENGDTDEPKPTKPSLKDYLLLDKKMRMIYVIILCVIVGIIVPSIISYYLGTYQADLGNCNPPTIYKLECMSGSFTPVTSSSCVAAGCCYDEGSTPKCFHRNPTRYTYLLTSDIHNKSYYSINLKPERRNTDYFAQSLPHAKVVVKAVNPQHLIVLLLKSDQSEDSSFRLLTEDQHTSFEDTDFDVYVSLDSKKSFGVTIKRKDTGTVLLDTTRGPLVINDQYVEMTTTVPSEYVYGLGQERKISFTRGFGYSKTALYNRPGGTDGFHPFYMAIEPYDGLVHGVFWDNPYPLELQFNPAPSISFRAMGGNGVFHLFSGPTPAAVSEQFFKDIIGPAVMPPFWSLGFHLCRESDNSTVFRHTVDAMIANNISFDSDCIDRRLSGPGAGKLDKTNFPEADDDRQKLLNVYKKFILSQPPHVADDALQYQWVSINTTNDIGRLTGTRFDYNVTYPSFKAINEYTDDGDWNDMGNPDGLELVDNWPSNARPNCVNVTKPFVPERLRENNGLNSESLCIESWHPSLGQKHLAVHNHYGIQHLNAVTRQGKGYAVRWLYLNRASALGNLGMAGYSGDESLTGSWLSLKAALVQVLEMGLFGIPLSGSPICGSTNSTSLDSISGPDDEQLCIRWYQLGLLLPYAHSINKLNHRPRSPIDWSVSSRRVIATYIQQRYQLLPYFYTLFYEATTKGTPLVRPMFYQFPNDKMTYNISEQFMIGEGIMVCPVLTQELVENSSVMKAYFPSGTWYDYYTGDRLIESSQGQFSSVVTSLIHVNMFVRNATVFVTQEAGKSAEETRKNSYTVTTAFPLLENGTSEGYLYVDDGITSDKTAYDLIRFSFTNSTFTMNRIYNGFPGSDGISTVVDTVRIFGFPYNNAQKLPSNAVYNIQYQVLQLNQLNLNWTGMEEPKIIHLFA